MARNIFNTVEMTRPKRNFFDLTHDVKMSLNMGELVPTCCIETVPGDSFTIGCESLVRFAPMVAPVMHRFDVYMHYFFVPQRLIWSNWENWIAGGDAPGAGYPNPVAPPFLNLTVLTPANNVGTLRDYLGIPGNGLADIKVYPGPFSAYQLIYNEYYRDQNLIAEAAYKLVSGDNVASYASLTTLRKRAWEHDYFTAALPFAQKGAQVSIPLAQFNNVEVHRDTNPAQGANTLVATTGTTGAPNPMVIQNFVDVFNNPDISDGELYAATSKLNTNATPINDLRRAFRLQEWLEKAARAGTRYKEAILSFFGVMSPDARLDRPEYITGTKSPIVVSEVLATSGNFSPTNGDPGAPPVGSMAGHGVGVTSGGYGKYYCQEHGYIMGIMSIMPKTAYQQGVHKMWFKMDKFDHFWPQFEHIGEQAVTNQELYIDNASPGATFGYVPRFSEYKYQPSRVAGEFRTTLDHWHEGRIFATPPALNQSFVECNPDTRIFAVPEAKQHLYCHVLHKIKAVRPMAKFGSPSF